MKKTLLMILLYLPLGLAAPDITGATGDFSTEGNSVTIGGTGFGSNNLDIEWTKDWIEQQNPGAELDSRDKWEYQWVSGEGEKGDEITTERAWSGTKSWVSRTDRALGDWSTDIKYTHDTIFNEIYVTFWIYFDPYKPDSGQNTQWKFWRINSGKNYPSSNGGTIYPVDNPQGEIYNPNYVTSSGRYTTSGLTPHCQTGCDEPTTYCLQNGMPVGYNINGGKDNPPDGYNYWWQTLTRGEQVPPAVWEDYLPTIRGWSRVELHGIQGTRGNWDGYFRNTILKPGIGRTTGFEWDGILFLNTEVCRNPADPWQVFYIQNYFDSNSAGGGFDEAANFYFDDIFIQIGSQARVELCDSEIFDQATNCEVQKPVTWTSDLIAFEANFGGSFNPGDTVWAFVIDDSGAVNPTGFEITLNPVSDLRIHDPGTFPEATVSDATLQAIHENLELDHAPPIITAIDPLQETVTESGNWPAGSWEQGYYSEGDSDWITTPHTNGNYYGSHPRVRRSAEFGRGYVHSLIASADLPLAEQRMSDAVAFLRDNEQVESPASERGGFISWGWRPDQTTPNLDQNILVFSGGPHNRFTWHAGGRAVEFIAKAYATSVHEGGTVNNPEYLDPLVRGADWLRDDDYGLSDTATPNINFHAHALRGLVAAYKTTGDTSYKTQAETIAAMILTTQDDQEPFSGMFYQDFPARLNTEGSPAQTFYHDTKLWYHVATTWALIETYGITDQEPLKTDLRRAIRLAVNHLIDKRITAEHDFTLWDVDVTGTPANPSNYATVDPSSLMEALGALTLIAKNDPAFSSEEVTNLRNFMNRMAQRFPGLMNRYWFSTQAAYRNYISSTCEACTVDTALYFTVNPSCTQTHTEEDFIIDETVCDGTDNDCDDIIDEFCYGDTNGDGTRDIADLAIQANHFRAEDGDLGWNPHWDSNGDQRVDIRDLIQTALNFG